MLIIKCDRCGKEKITSSLFPLPMNKDDKFLNKYTISMQDDQVKEKIRLLNFCSDCEKDLNDLLDNFIKN